MQHEGALATISLANKTVISDQQLQRTLVLYLKRCNFRLYVRATDVKKNLKNNKKH